MQIALLIDAGLIIKALIVKTFLMAVLMVINRPATNPLFPYIEVVTVTLIRDAVNGEFLF